MIQKIAKKRNNRLAGGGLFLLLTLALLGTAGVPEAAAQILDRPVAIVRLTKTVNIGQREIRQQTELLERQLGRTLSRENREEVLEAQIGDVLIRQAAERAQIRVTDEEVQQAVQLQRQQLDRPVSESDFRRLVRDQMGMTWEAYLEELRTRLIQERFIMERARESFGTIPEPTAREIRQVYEENAQQFTNPAMARFEHLFFDLRNRDTAAQQAARRRAAEISRNIERGTTTFQAQMRASLDDTSFSGGDFGYLVRGDEEARRRLGRSFVETLLDLEEGDVSGVLESNVGLHIVRITDRRSPRLLQLDDPLLPGETMTVRDQIRGYILSQRQQDLFQDSIQTTLEELMEEAEIRRFPEHLDW
ncbi:periplasmic chaperone for outer membrane proteins SurA [Alkalispirochaeta americana]|uniref:Periplasmic chaperone for outer membrane proteins SurA n=1 Tax=Alkalispirochaeta americana TaxID=159291 RepID=A0A1N6P3R3_9SPIO|nr:peptidyl-prolyl cis-trans isomerase [Alkalispirochaeta americana]SIP98975.1 periplasmic chaperone for outer membrane proteins SurA [Alkalispirochaeta americana]